LATLGTSDGGAPASYQLRLLDAETCFNATSIGLATALNCFPRLTYLNLSRTSPARHPLVFAALRNLPALQVLKLRGLGLRDEDIWIIAKAIGLRVRSLDVRDNRLTNESVRFILQECVLTPGRAAEVLYQNVSRAGGMTPGMHMYFGHELPTVFKTDFQDTFIRHRLTSEFFHNLGMEVASGTGVTHLYISGNDLTVTSVADMLRIQRFHVLDVGNIRSDSRSASPAGNSYRTAAPLVGVEDLTPLIDQYGIDLTHLRLSHEIVTKLSASRTSLIAELDSGYTGTVPSDGTSLHDIPALCELQGDARTVQELPGDNTFIFELEGSPVTPGLRENKLQTMRSEEVDNRDPVSPLHAQFSLSTPETMLDVKSSPLLSPLPLMSPNSTSPTGSLQTPAQLLPPRARSYSGVHADHEARISFKMSQPHALLPSMLPQLRSLALTNVPTHWSSDIISQRIITFISLCAEEAHWSRLRAQQAYSLPPGRDRLSSERLYAISLFQLKRLVLEMKSTRAGQNGVSVAAHRNAPLSSVEDPDCETFWQAASGDFSFFGNGAEAECGVPELEMRQSIPLEVTMGKMAVTDDVDAAYGMSPRRFSNRGASPESQIAMFDVLAEVSKFRRQKKAAYDAAIRRGDTDVYIEGYWEGDIVVMRPDGPR
jgi:hypothetical protein